MYSDYVEELADHILQRLALRFHSWDFDISNYEIFINEFQIV